MTIPGNAVLVCFILCTYALQITCQETSRLKGDIIRVEIASVGHIYPDSLGCLPYVGPPQDIALDMIQRKYEGVFNFSLQYIFDRRIKSCNELGDNAVNLLAPWLFKPRNAKIVRALISPSCTDAETFSLNQLASEHNLLMITSINNQNVIRNKKLSPTLVSVSHYSDGAYFDFYRAIVTTYKWLSVFLLIDDSTMPQYYVIVSRTVVQSLSTIINQTVTVRHLKRSQPIQYQEALREFQSVSRVLLFFGQAEHARSLLIHAVSLNMTDGEYVYITTETFVYPLLFGKLDWRYGDENDKVARDAFESLLVIRPVDFNETLPPGGAMNPAEISQRALSNYNFSLLLTEQPSLNLIAAYLSVEMFAQVLNESFVKYGSSSLTDGRHLAGMFIDKTFDTFVGKIAIDGFGQRTVDFMLSGFDATNTTFTPFLFMNTKTGKTQVLKDFSWTKGKTWPPRNEPKCGFSGDSWDCRTTTNTLLSGSLTAILIMALLALFALIYCYRSHYLAEKAYFNHILWRLDEVLLLPAQQTVSHGDT
ncbi:hypothetical protein BV898_15648 [Hypsibius exemplaris]|uniref:Receptor ligand binding region domain-containing protein n=1 Tax=Hypsibius exemplaris TaxID=2072580 RepID=A0A9X6RKJ1_HYPEX|nr:hypothetical protein BV898_15648 [Hypsibius exemplaris]